MDYTHRDYLNHWKQLQTQLWQERIPNFSLETCLLKRAAIICSLLGSCKQQGINPYDYLLDVLQRLAEQPLNRLVELLPTNWKPVNRPLIPAI